MKHERTINGTIPEINYNNEEIREVLRNNIIIDYYYNRKLIEETLKESPLLKKNRDLIKTIKKLSPKILKKKIKNAKKKSLLQLNLFTKAVCDANCDICYTSELRDYVLQNKKLELNLKDIKEIIDQAKKLGTRSVYIAGAGEPFCDPNFLTIVKYCKGKRMDVMAFTNGIRLGRDKKLVNEVKKYKNLRLIGKVWHTNPKKNDELIGVRVHQYKEVKLKNGRKIKLPAYILELMNAKIKLAIETCVRPVNYNSAKRDLIPFCRENDIPFVLEGIFHGGRGRKMGSHQLTKKQVRSLVPYIINHCKRSQYTYAVSNIGTGSHCHANIRLDKKGRIIINEKNNFLYKNLFELMHTDNGSVEMRYLCISKCPHYASYKWLRGK